MTTDTQGYDCDHGSYTSEQELYAARLEEIRRILSSDHVSRETRNP